MAAKTGVLIMGAAGRDFHNFNILFRNNPSYYVVAFTAAQLPNISGRRYPRELAGKLYPNGIPIHDESELPTLIRKHSVDVAVLSYSDLPYFHVMHKASLANSLGADFWLPGAGRTMLHSRKPVIAVTAVRTGCGKSQTTREVCRLLKARGKKPVVVRHPMPYGDLKKQEVQRFATHKDLDKYDCTIEEREEYEPVLDMGITLFAGVDYGKILKRAEKEADIIVWDGGNNDTPFFKPDLHICLTDPHRPGHEISYYPGETNLRMADVVIINKETTAPRSGIEIVRKNIKKYNPGATIVDAGSVIKANNPELIRNKRVLVVEDGPTLTHGGMPYGAGTIAAKRLRAKIVDPRPHAKGSIRMVFENYPRLNKVLPAMGYSRQQVRELEETINKTKCDAVVSGTPIDLRKVLEVNKPIARIRYELREIGKPDLDSIITRFLKKL